MTTVPLPQAGLIVTFAVAGGLMAAAASVAWGAAPTSAPAAAPKVGEATVVRTAADILRAEARWSPALRNYRRNYRMTLMLEDKVERQKRMLKMAKEVAPLLPAQSDEELATWLELQQGLYAAGGKPDLATAAMEQRYTLLSGQPIKLGKQTRLSPAAQTGKTVDLDKLAEQALKEAAVLTALKDYELAKALHTKAASVAPSKGMRLQAVIGVGHVISEEKGMEAAVEYYLSLAQGKVESLAKGKVKIDPEVAREAHYRAAVEYYHHGQLEQALKVLDDIEASYPDTPEAENARHARRGWMKTPGEQ